MNSEKFEQWTNQPEQVYANCSHCGEECEDVLYTEEDVFCSDECENEYHITESY